MILLVNGKLDMEKILYQSHLKKLQYLKVLVQYIKGTNVDMKNNKNYIIENVELNSYSSSKNFKGFCFSETGYHNSNYIHLLIEILLSLVDKIQLVSSLNIEVSLLKHSKDLHLDKQGIICRDLLIKNKVITTKSTEVESSDFHFNKEIDLDLAYNLIYFVTSLGGASGSAFFVDSENEIIIYPHDDCGLGFIIKENSKNDILNVLKKLRIKYRENMEFRK